MLNVGSDAAQESTHILCSSSSLSHGAPTDVSGAADVAAVASASVASAHAASAYVALDAAGVCQHRWMMER